MKRPIVFTLLAISAVALPLTAQAQHAGGAVERQVDELFAELDRPDSPGAAVLVLRDGEVLYRKGFGQANLEHGIAISPSTVFDIASVSKQFAGMAISLLVERGRIDLGDDIREYLPDLPSFAWPVTIDNLVHHTSGIRDWPGTLAVAGWQMDDVISFDQILTMARNQTDLNFQPGAEYSYSNTGYNILAALVAEVSGMSFREFTDINLFQPLGMTDTHFQDDHAEIVENRALGYAPLGEGFRNIHNGLTALGSSSLFTSVDDLAKWVMNFDDGRVGGMSVLERMQQRGVLNDGEVIAYAFGQGAGEYRGLETWGHTGSWAGSRTVVTRFPEQDFGVVILSNLATYNPSPKAQAIADLYLGDLLEPMAGAEAATPSQRPVVAVDTGLLDEYTGLYGLGPGVWVTVERLGEGLTVQIAGEPRQSATAVSDREFFVEAYSVAVTFGRDALGAVDNFTWDGTEAPRVAARGKVEDLSEYVGEYYSGELDTSYRFSVHDGTLVANHRRHEEIELTPMFLDGFRGSTWFFGTVEFDRDEAGRVVAVRITQGRSRNMKFERRGGDGG